MRLHASAPKLLFLYDVLLQNTEKKSFLLLVLIFVPFSDGLLQYSSLPRLSLSLVRSLVELMLKFCNGALVNLLTVFFITTMILS